MLINLNNKKENKRNLQLQQKVQCGITKTNLGGKIIYHEKISFKVFHVDKCYSIDKSEKILFLLE